MTASSKDCSCVRCEIFTGPLSIASPFFFASVLISFIRAQGNVSSIPKRMPIRLFATCVIALPLAARAAGAS
jgi:hypothetical protein